MILSFSATGLLALSLSFVAYEPADTAPRDKDTAVEVDGVKFSVADVQRKGAGAIFQAKHGVFEAERKAAEEVVSDYLLEREAKKENITVDELLKRHVGAVSDQAISEDALRVYYDGLDVAEPFEAVREKIVEVIRQRRATKAKAAYMKALRSKAAVDFRLTPPRGTISTDKTHFRGTPGAVVKVLEYADYECPYCQQIQPVIAKLERDFKGRIEFGFKDVPLPNHANAQKAAEASRCAGVQGKFWEYHDILFESKQLALPMLKSHAEALKLDVSAFNKCLDSGAQSESVKADLAEATALALPGTPGFFVNGRFITGTIDYEMLRRVVDEELKLASTPSRSAANSGGQR